MEEKKCGYIDYEAFFRLNPLRAIAVDKEGKIAAFNEAQRRSGGILPKAGDALFLEYAGEQGGEMRGELMDCIESKTVKQFPSRKCGEKYFSISMMPSKSGAIISLEDISECHALEESLRETEGKYRALFEKGPIGVAYHQMMYDARGEPYDYRFIDVNGIYEELTGVNPRGKTAKEAFPGIEMDKFDWIGTYAKVVQTGKQVRFDQLLEYNGRWYDCVAYRYKPEHFAVAFLEISERKKAESVLLDSINPLKSFIKESPIYAFIKDVTPFESRVLMASENYVDMVGIPGSEMIGKTMSELFPPDFAAKILADDWEVVANGKIIKQDEELDGRSFVTIKFPILSQNRNLLAGYTIDITDRKQAEEENLRLQERLRHSNKMDAIGTLAGGIAHDFNNILMCIQGYASLALMEPGLSPANHDRLKRVEEQVKSASGLTSQLLGFARGGRYNIRPIRMNDVILATSSLFGRTKKEISIWKSLAKDLLNVEADKGQMEQVLLNLYVNAWQAMPGGGEICLKTENVYFDEKQAFSHSVKSGAYVRISVSDNGTGMDERTMARIFDPFFTTKEMGRGTGLGLATVYGIIKGHKGIIEVRSEPEKGTTFIIHLPASEKTALEEKAEPIEIEGGSETILVLDDEESFLEVCREMLERIGHRVIALQNGYEAIELLKREKGKIDLVILDMIMPRISGGETFDRLREIDPSLKILLSSGYPIDGEAQSILNRGCNGFIQKPFQIDRLSQQIREIIRM